MTTDELLAERLRVLGDAVAPRVEVDTSSVIPRATRRRAAVRLVGVGAALVVGGCVWSAAAAMPWAGGAASRPAAPARVAPTYDGGDISEAQYLGIVQAVRDCMIDRGFSVSDVEKRTDGVTYSFTIDGGGDRGSGTGVDNRLECEAQHDLAAAEVAYQDQHVLAGAERDAAFDRFAACMALAGLPDVDPSDTASEITDRIGRIMESAEGGDGTAAESCWSIYGALLYGAHG